MESSEEIKVLDEMVKQRDQLILALVNKQVLYPEQRKLLRNIMEDAQYV